MQSLCDSRPALFEIEVRKELFFGNEPRCLPDNSPKGAGIEVAMRWDGQYLRSTGDDAFQLHVAAALRDLFESEPRKNGGDVVSR